MKKFSFWLPIGIWMGVIFFFSSLSIGGSSEIHWQDFIVKKTAHVVEYFALSVLIYRALINSDLVKKKAAFWSVSFSFFYGISDEFHQSFVPGREPHLRDVGFDTIGAALAIYFLWKLLPKMPVILRNWAKKLDLS